MTIRVFLTLCLLCYSYSILSQSVKEDMKSNEIYYSGFNPSQIDTIKKYWKQYFVRDIYPDLLGTQKIDYYPLFIDSYGGLYPATQIYPDKFDFTTNTNSDLNLLRYSHYQNFRYNPVLKTKLATTGFDVSSIKYNNPQSRDSADQTEINQFYDDWNGYFLSKAVDSIKQRAVDKEHIIFFVHGYNVPYSLAVVQSISLLKKLEEQGLKLENTLLIPVFWSSNDQKNSQIAPADDFNVQDDKGFENLEKWMYYSNRAYYAGLTLRQILNGLDPSKIGAKDTRIISHSLGATIATTACINTTSKLSNGNISDDLKNKMASPNYPLPSYPIKLFLSAPAIPGKNTFRDMNSSFFNKTVFSTINKKDRMLTKFFLLPARLSSTTLGCNHLFEVKKTRRFFFKNKLYDNFFYKKVSRRRDHDIFTYMRQKEYLEFLGEFLEK